MLMQNSLENVLESAATTQCLPELILIVTVLFYKSLSCSYLVFVAIQVVVDQAQNLHLPASMCRLKTQQYRDPRQTSCHNKSVDSPFGRYIVSYFDQLADLWVGLHLQRIECSMAG